MLTRLFTGIGFLAVALTQRSRIVAVAAAIFGLVTGVEQPLRAISTGITNNFPEFSANDFIRDHGSAVIFAVLGVLLLAAGAVAFRRERIG